MVKTRSVVPSVTVSVIDTRSMRSSSGPSGLPLPLPTGAPEASSSSQVVTPSAVPPAPSYCQRLLRSWRLKLRTSPASTGLVTAVPSASLAVRVSRRLAGYQR
ncbi:hypothetical protein GON03_09165 [Nocardioides sp. MAH-18]|uniref:Uncharacterized protein n=1 Tax=Nocardioides agri TaxID=2682843 RepID=A0A6L6XRG4_9ACTN|nr:hypothetical protein [Nocardioides sp. MAH-18]